MTDLTNLKQGFVRSYRKSMCIAFVWSVVCATILMGPPFLMSSSDKEYITVGWSRYVVDGYSDTGVCLLDAALIGVVGIYFAVPVLLRIPRTMRWLAARGMRALRVFLLGRAVAVLVFLAVSSVGFHLTDNPYHMAKWKIGLEIGLVLGVMASVSYAVYATGVPLFATLAREEREGADPPQNA